MFNEKNKKNVAIIFGIAGIIAIGIAAYIIMTYKARQLTVPPSSGTQQSAVIPVNNKCGDGICDTKENQNHNLCPGDCPKSTDSSGNNSNAINNSDAKLNTSKVENKFLDVAYGTQSSAQKMNIYLPSGAGPFPVIIAIHGGAFSSGSKDAIQITPMLKGVNRGYAVVSINYRLSGEEKFPAAIDDVQKAIIFTKENAQKYKLDANKIALWGSSAGGNLAALAGTKGEKSKNTNVQAVVDWFGPIDFSTINQEFQDLNITSAAGVIKNVSVGPESTYLGVTIGTSDAQEIVKQANPQTYISNDDPPFFIQHGTMDTNIPVTQSENFANALRKVIGDNNVIFEKLEGAGHGGTEFITVENLDKVFSFLDKYLK